MRHRDRRPVLPDDSAAALDRLSRLLRCVERGARSGIFVYVYLTRDAYPGWTSLAVLLLLIGGFVMIAVGVTGLYSGRSSSRSRAARSSSWTRSSEHGPARVEVG